MTGAIIIIGAEVAELPSENALCGAGSAGSRVPLWFVEILGCSVLERTIRDLRRCGVDAISVLADTKWSGNSEIGHPPINLRWVENAWVAAAQELRTYQESGINATFVMRANGYAETDYADLLQFHLEQKKDVTGVLSHGSPLDLWVVDTFRFAPDATPDATLDRQLSKNGTAGAPYSSLAYVNSLRQARDMRRLVADCFNSTCRLRPDGHETRPGVWISDGAGVHRGARIVAPAFIGRGAKVEEQCLITRCSNVESNCLIDYGTVVEDSCVLANTYVGIGLDITHSVVSGNTLLNLQRDVALQIADQGIIRPHRVLRKEANRLSVPSPRLVGTH